MPRLRARPFALALAALLFSVGLPGAQKKSPHVEISARAEVVTEPLRTVHKNKRTFLEFEVRLLSYVLAPEQPAGADRLVPIDMQGTVKVVHDLSCGGDDLVLATGDRVELQGEYVEMPRVPDLIHFTHAAGAKAGCGSGGGHPGGYLRKPVVSTPTRVPTPPRPSTLIPEQPYLGTPVAGAKPYAALLAMKQGGATDEQILERIRTEKKRYALSIYDVQQLRADGFSPKLIEAMLQAGAASTPAPVPSATPLP